ncbi:hypothetical protein PHYSODRAFT_459591, partial [Phytophthora sojae]
MPVTMWLKTVRAEVRRQAATMGVQWSDGQLYHEVAAHLDGEAKRWFATVMESVPPEEENINTLAGMLRAKYMTQDTTPERGDVGESWLVSAFMKGMSSTEGATHVRGHRPKTLDGAVNLAVPHVGEYGEGYGAQYGRGPLAAAKVTSGQEQSGLRGNSRNEVTGYGPMWGTTQKPPRYDTEGRPVSTG